MGFFSKPKYYRPGIGGSLLILLVMFFVGGLLSTIVAFAAAAVGGNLTMEALSTPEGIVSVMSGNLSAIYFAQMIV
ncbi:MAG: hypothetical protein IK041_02840, partial [Bacteroidales bacterium]|nr:hypothetical protein [Bacteroidales bacterium]